MLSQLGAISGLKIKSDQRQYVKFAKGGIPRIQNLNDKIKKNPCYDHDLITLWISEQHLRELYFKRLHNSTAQLL